jgi:glycosyltransferase involved in cell wall biosynthesis
MSTPLTYVVITPARNEAESIERTIRSMISQTSKPIRWAIVSDGSTDGTDEIVLKHCAVHDWMKLVRMPERHERHFAGKAEAFNVGYAVLKELSFDLVGNLDADLSFDEDFFEFLIGKFMDNPRLGIGGAPFQEDGKTYDFRFSSIDHVSGACQLFRRGCYEEIGGYSSIKAGGIDVVAVLTARMRGWQTQTFTEKVYIHHRKMGTAQNSVMKSRFKDGQKDYALGAHPAWVIFRAIYQMSKRPLVLGGCALISGYFYSKIKRAPRPVSSELIRFRREDQIRRLREFVKKIFRGRGLNHSS